MIRTRMTPEVIARSLAVGVFWGSSATVGFQFIGIGLYWVIAHRLNRPFSVAIAVILTNITNPFTITPAYSLFILTGCAIAPGCMGGAALVNDLVTRLQTEGAFAAVQDSGYLLVLAFLGSLPYAIPATIGAYFLGHFIGRRLEARRRRKARKPPDDGGTADSKPQLVVKALRDKLS